MRSTKIIIDCITFWLPKQGNATSEYEDAFSSDKIASTGVEVFRCAVADGATEASFSQSWAKILANGYVEGFDLPKLQEAWRAETTQQDLPWYAEEKAQMGAFAALVGLTIQADKQWQSRAIGDSCLVHVRSGKIISTFPLTKAEQFNDTPFLLSSKETNNQEIEDFWLNSSGSWKNKDMFLLMTDALSQWLFKQHEQGTDALAMLLALNDQNSFSKLIEEARNQSDTSKHMKNDDVTLMKLTAKSTNR
jgi:hypothetical protein